MPQVRSACIHSKRIMVGFWVYDLILQMCRNPKGHLKMGQLHLNLKRRVRRGSLIWA